jgi:hypothetical protein
MNVYYQTEYLLNIEIYVRANHDDCYGCPRLKKQKCYGVCHCKKLQRNWKEFRKTQYK